MRLRIAAPVGCTSTVDQTWVLVEERKEQVFSVPALLALLLLPLGERLSEPTLSVSAQPSHMRR